MTPETRKIIEDNLQAAREAVSVTKHIPPGFTAEQRDQLFALREARGWSRIRRQTELIEKRTGDKWRARRNQLREKLFTGFTVALVGDRGVGKTQMGADLMLTVTDFLKSAEYVSATGLFSEVKSSYHPVSKLTEPEVTGQFCQPRFLVIDEYEKRGDTDWENRILFDILNIRYGMKKDTILLSNLTHKTFVEMLGPSMASRINETGGIITCDWPSFRQ